MKSISFIDGDIQNYSRLLYEYELLDQTDPNTDRNCINSLNALKAFIRRFRKYSRGRF